MITRYRRLLLVVVGATALMIAIWWKRRMPEGAIEVCERFTTLVMTSKCHEAYKLSVESTYSFASVDTFCAGQGDDYDRVSVVCQPGKWDGGEYLLEGALERSRATVHYPSVSFGMVLRKISGKWYVVRWSLSD